MLCGIMSMGITLVSNSNDEKRIIFNYQINEQINGLRQLHSPSSIRTHSRLNQFHFATQTILILILEPVFHLPLYLLNHVVKVFRSSAKFGSQSNYTQLLPKRIMIIMIAYVRRSNEALRMLYSCLLLPWIRIRFGNGPINEISISVRSWVCSTFNSVSLTEI